MQKLFTLFACLALSIAISSCGSSKKKDSEDELGISGGKLRNGKGSGDKPATPPMPFDKYCASLKGPGTLLTPAMCRYEKQSIIVTTPANFNFGIYVKDLAVARRGWTIQTSGDPSGAATLYTVDNGVVQKLLDIDGTVRRQRLEIDAIGLRLMATQAFSPATIKIYECLDQEHHQIMCNPF
ncbi:MAG: hypothetical protein ACXWQO_11265 [Bdellovibrionota bacterium]